MKTDLSQDDSTDHVDSLALDCREQFDEEHVEQVEEGRMNSSNVNGDSVTDHFGTVGQGISLDYEKLVDGDAVKTRVVDVDNVIDATCRLSGESNDPHRIREVSRREGDFADCISEVTDELRTVVDLPDDKPLTHNGKLEIPLAHYPDMDEASSPTSNRRPNNTLPPDSSMGSAPSAAVMSLSSRSSDMMSAILHPIPLRPSIPRRPMFPGAFAVSPMNTVDVDGDDDETIGTIQILSSPEEATDQLTDEGPRPQQDEMLVQATLVQDGDAADPIMLMSSDHTEWTGHSEDQEEATNGIALVEAKPLVYPQITFRSSIRSKWTQCNILLIIGLISVAIALGVMAIQAPTGNDSNSSEPPLNSPTTPAPSSGSSAVDADDAKLDESGGAVEAALPTPSPTQSMPMSRQDLHDHFPEYTKEAMKSAESAQYRAFDWLWNDPYLTSYSYDRIEQRFALMTLLISFGINELVLGGDHMHEAHECDWNALSLPCNSQQMLSGILLSNVNLQGSIPPELGLLTHLQKLDLSQNDLGGEMPTTFGQLSGLKVANLSQNKIKGWLPNNLSFLSRLEALDLSINWFRYNLPAELGFLTSLRQLRLSHNSFSGTFPASLQHLTVLESLSLANNLLRGNLDNLAKLTSLQVIEFNDNRFTGYIPESLGALANTRELNLSNNRLSGTVPPSLGKLYNATTFELQGNALRGILPVEVCTLREFFSLGEVILDCTEVECWCKCHCFTDQPEAVEKAP